MESWRHVWRNGVAPLLSRECLLALRRGIMTDDPELVQGATAIPCVRQFDCRAACAIGYAGWKGHELDTVEEVEEFFARMCLEIDKRLGEQAACRGFLNHFDETPREVFFPMLLEEVNLALEGKHDPDDLGPTGNCGVDLPVYVVKESV